MNTTIKNSQKKIVVNKTAQVNKTGLKRDTSDKFYTNDNVVLLCNNLIKQYLKLNKNDLIIEPSAGNGAFINAIKKLSNNYKFYDISPNNKEVIKQDYLLLDTQQFIDKFKNIHVIGNPPFGRQSSLAIKFIKKSCDFCNTISFILPKSFKKDSMKKYFPLEFHLICQHDLPKNSFLVDGKEYNVPCVFQIWIKKDEKRIVPKILVPHKYKFVNKDALHDISFRRVGVYAGKIDQDTAEKSKQSHYFIKFNDGVFSEELFKKLQNIEYKKSEDTVGPKSISKQELIKEFSVILEGY